VCKAGRGGAQRKFGDFCVPGGFFSSRACLLWDFSLRCCVALPLGRGLPCRAPSAVGAFSVFWWRRLLAWLPLSLPLGPGFVWSQGSPLEACGPVHATGFTRRMAQGLPASWARGAPLPWLCRRLLLACALRRGGCWRLARMWRGCVRCDPLIRCGPAGSRLIPVLVPVTITNKQNALTHRSFHIARDHACMLRLPLGPAL
jgi:hypothetical protein